MYWYVGATQEGRDTSEACEPLGEIQFAYSFRRTRPAERNFKEDHCEDGRSERERWQARPMCARHHDRGCRMVTRTWKQRCAAYASVLKDEETWTTHMQFAVDNSQVEWQGRYWRRVGTGRQSMAHRLSRYQGAGWARQQEARSTCQSAAMQSRMRVSICCPWSRAATGLVTEQKWQSAAVTRPLQSVDGTCDAGTRVMLGRGGGIVQNLSTDEITLLIRETGAVPVGRVDSSLAGRR